MSVNNEKLNNYIYNPAESARHKLIKNIVKNQIIKANRVIFHAEEYSLGLYRPDIYIEYENSHRKINKLAVEIQCSAKNYDNFVNKTKYYTNKGIATLWIFDFPKEWLFGKSRLKDDLVSVPKIMLQSHLWNYGQCYFINQYDKLISVHFKGSKYSTGGIFTKNRGYIPEMEKWYKYKRYISFKNLNSYRLVQKKWKNNDTYNYRFRKDIDTILTGKFASYIDDWWNYNG